MKKYDEVVVTVILFPVDDAIRTSGVNENGEDNDGGWDSAWDRM